MGLPVQREPPGRQPRALLEVGRRLPPFWPGESWSLFGLAERLLGLLAWVLTG